MEVLEPDSLEEVPDAVRSAPRVSVVGGGSKPPLRSWESSGGFARLGTRRLAGVVEYDPGEFTITVRAGTRVAELREVLREHGQHLPCDPPLAGAGATIGGTVAAGLNGPGALRFGGIRDFLLGVVVVDGTGRRLQLGGKVVKNAAGFDVARLLVGSLGCLGVLVELTFKVFPRPEAEATIRIPVDGPGEAVDVMRQLGSGTWDLEALRYLPAADSCEARIGGTPEAVDRRAARLCAATGGERLAAAEAAAGWRAATEFTWVEPSTALAKIPVNPGRIIDLVEAFDEPVVIDLGGQVAYVAGDPAGIRRVCARFGLEGLVVRGRPAGDAGPWLGRRRDGGVHGRLVDALDPAGRFPPPPWLPMADEGCRIPRGETPVSGETASRSK